MISVLRFVGVFLMVLLFVSVSCLIAVSATGSKPLGTWLSPEHKKIPMLGEATFSRGKRSPADRDACNGQLTCTRT